MKKLPAANPEKLPEPRPKASSSWAACIKRILEIDPIECPKCKSQMRIIDFITDSNEIIKIRCSLNIPDFQKPPALPRAPPITESFYDFDLS